MQVALIPLHDIFCASGAYLIPTLSVSKTSKPGQGQV